ncbi:MAG: hypothetical protein UIM53_01025 [Acutalibacteraceae bacterium]|nr:hypothetical protein [Acutalibacteraceae bacterium]
MRDDRGYLNGFGWTVVIVIITLFVLLITGTIMYIIPKYNVWSRELKGKAQLKESEYSKQVLIEEAKANLEAEKLNAESEIERAKGMAKAMEIENGKLTDTYIKYLWVRSMTGNEANTIYIPTEAGLPILERK